MIYYERKAINSKLFLFAGILFLISAILNFSAGDATVGIFYVIVAIIFFFDAYIYRKPYIGLGDGKIIVNQGILKKEIDLKNITSIEKAKRNLIISYTAGSSPKKIKLLLNTLKDKEKFMKDLNKLRKK